MQRIDLGLLLLRVGFGTVLAALHGASRLASAFGHHFGNEPWSFVSYVERMGFPFPGAFAAASALSESVAVALVIAGMFTRTASLLIAGNFTVATISEAAQGDPYELPALYLFWAAVLMMTGPGRYSLETWLGQRRHTTPVC